MEFKKENLITIAYINRLTATTKLASNHKFESKRTISYKVQKDQNNTHALEVKINIGINARGARKKLVSYAGFKKSIISYNSFIIEDERSDLYNHIGTVLTEAWCFVIANEPNLKVDVTDNFDASVLCDQIIASLKHSGFYD